MERPDWMPETRITRDESINFLMCICYHCVLRCSAPDASPEDKALLPGLAAAMVELLKMV